MANPNLPNYELLTKILAGSGIAGPSLKSSVVQLVSVIDQQDATNRFEWSGLPDGITSAMIEQMLYRKGQVCFFWNEADERYYVLPYTLAGNIDCYGRWKTISPVVLGADGENEKTKHFISGLEREPYYGVGEFSQVGSCVLIRDYGNAYVESRTPRMVLNRPLIDVESDCVPFMRTALLNSTGIQGIRVADEECSSNVMAASRAMDAGALNGDKFVPIVGAIEFQDLTGGNAAQTADFLMAMESLDNLRLSTLGIPNGGLFQKTERKLAAEQQMNAQDAEAPLRDGLRQREEAASYINTVFGLNVSVKSNYEARTNPDGGEPETQPIETKTEKEEN